jgi:hypothetical protein
MSFLPQPVYANGEPLGEGDWIKVFVPRLGVWHHGIVRHVLFVTPGLLGVYVVHNRKATGITTTDFCTFAEAQRVFLHSRPSPDHIAGIFSRVDNSIGKPYHLFNQNCEHFASYAFTGKAESKSIQVVGLLAAGAVVLSLFASE